MEEDIKEILTALDNTTKKQLDEAIANADKEWSEMELEEDIKILENYLEQQDRKFVSEYRLNFLQAIEHLIARNKKLEEENKTITDEYMIQKHLINADFLEDYIPKSKVREILEKLKGHNYKCNFDDVNFLQNIIIEIQSLLED